MGMMPINPPFLVVSAQGMTLPPPGVDDGRGVGGVHHEMHAAVFLVGMADLVAEFGEGGGGGLQGEEGGDRAFEEGVLNQEFGQVGGG